MTLLEGSSRSTDRCVALRCVQIDHTHVDIQLVDGQGRVIGRPLLAICLDVNTRMILGLTVSMTSLSAHALARAFFAAVMPKREQLARLRLSARWPCFGLPQSVHSDNGTDLVSNAFEGGLTEHVIEHIKRPIGDPKYGGHMERVFKTLNTYIHFLPGTTMSNVAKLDGRKPAETACLTHHEFERLLVNYVCDVYHKSCHTELFDTPENVWDRWWAGQGEQPLLPQDPQRFRLSFLPYETRRIGKYGITFNHLTYQCRTLQRMRDCGVKGIRFHYDPVDIRTLFGRDDKGAIFEIPCAKRFHQAISLSEWKDVRPEVVTNASRLADADLVRHFQLHEEILGQGKKRRAKRRKAKRESTDRVERSSSVPIYRPGQLNPFLNRSDGGDDQI